MYNPFQNRPTTRSEEGKKIVYKKWILCKDCCYHGIGNQSNWKKRWILVKLLANLSLVNDTFLANLLSRK